MMRWLWSHNRTEPTERQVVHRSGDVIDEMRMLTAELRALTAELNEKAARR